MDAERGDGIIKSLSKIAEFLLTVPDEQFNMQHWWLEDGMAFDDDRNRVYKVADGPCGCAVGHLIQIGALPGSVIDPNSIPSSAAREDWTPSGYRDRIFVQIADELKLYNYKIAEFLFDNYSYFHLGRSITKHDVIRRIEFIMTEVRALSGR
jgi:hypothetical protein